jgi:hypothetical protein
VLDVYYDRLKAINDESLSKNESEVKEKLLSLLDYMARIRVVDAPVLADIYERFRYKY